MQKMMYVEWKTLRCSAWERSMWQGAVVGVGVGVGSLEKILLNQVWKVWVANLLAKTMQAVWVVWSRRQIG